MTRYRGRRRPFSRWRSLVIRATLRSMSTHRASGPPKHVTVEVWQRNGRVYLDHYVHDEYVPGARQKFKQRRVVIDQADALDWIQLTHLARKMAEYVTAKTGPGHAVPQGLPYQEIGLPAQRSVPPARGGRGGGNPGEESTVRPIPKFAGQIYHQSTPSSAGGQRVARMSSGDLDLPRGWVEVPLYEDGLTAD